MPERTDCIYCTMPLTMYPHYVKCYTCLWQATPRELVILLKAQMDKANTLQKRLNDGIQGNDTA